MGKYEIELHTPYQSPLLAILSPLSSTQEARYRRQLSKCLDDVLPTLVTPNLAQSAHSVDSHTAGGVAVGTGCVRCSGLSSLARLASSQGAAHSCSACLASPSLHATCVSGSTFTQADPFPSAFPCPALHVFPIPSRSTLGFVHHFPRRGTTPSTTSLKLPRLNRFTPSRIPPPPHHATLSFLTTFLSTFSISAVSNLWFFRTADSGDTYRPVSNLFSFIPPFHSRACNSITTPSDPRSPSFWRQDALVDMGRAQGPKAGAVRGGWSVSTSARSRGLEH
jgi:hypothetical protein